MRSNLYTRYSDRPKFYSDAGSKTRPIYAATYDKAGNLELDVVGEEDIYSEIQSHADSCDINLIMKKFETTGDPSVLEKVQGLYGDFTKMPQTHQEVLNLNIIANQYFDLLPIDEKAKYGNSYEKWLIEYKPEIPVNVDDVPNLVQSEEVKTDES